MQSTNGFGDNFWDENTQSTEFKRDFFDSFRIQKETITSISLLFASIIIFVVSILKAQVFIATAILIMSLSIFSILQKSSDLISFIPLAVLGLSFIIGIVQQNNFEIILAFAVCFSIVSNSFALIEKQLFNQNSYIISLLTFYPIQTIVLLLSKYSFDNKILIILIFISGIITSRITYLYVGPMVKDLSNSTKRSQMLTRIAKNSRNIQEREPAEVVRGAVEIIMNLGAKSCHFLSADRRFSTFQMGEDIENIVEITKQCIDEGKIITIKPSHDKHSIIYGIPIRVGSRYACAIIVKLPKVPAYESSLLEAYEILASQTGRALDNANLTAQDRRLVEQLKDESLQDQLSGLGNRRYAEQYMSQLKVGDIVVMIDVDGLKIANDTFGHSAGDEIIKNVGIFLKQNIRNPDIAARIGGDEFLLILKNAETGADGFLDRIRAAWASYHIYDTSFSVGYAIHEFGATPQVTLQKADAGLYSSKKSGKNKVTKM